jgi:hypothetical protein
MMDGWMDGWVASQLDVFAGRPCSGAAAAVASPQRQSNSRWDTTLTRANLTFPPIVSLLKQKNEYFIFFNVH